jgi:capsular exopolysaccharide synthesis family protein
VSLQPLTPALAPATGAHVETASPPALRRGVTPAAVLAAVRRRWRTALALGLVLGVACAVAVYTLRPDKYTAYALLRIAPAEHKILQQEAARPQESSAYTRTQLALIRSRPVLNRALLDKTVHQSPLVQQQSDPLEWLEKELVAEQIQNTEVVRVSLTARGAGSDLAPIVNAVIDAYKAEVLNGEDAAQQRHLEDLRKLNADLESKLRDLRAAFQRQAKGVRGSDSKILTLKQQTLLEEYANHKRELAALNTRDRDLEIKVALYKVRLESSPVTTLGKCVPQSPFAACATVLAKCLPAVSENPAAIDALIERDLDADPRVAAAELDAAKMREQLRQFDAVSANPNSPIRADLVKKLDAAEEGVRTVRTERRPAVAARHQAFSEATARQQIQDTETQRAILATQRADLSEKVGDMKEELDRLGLGSVELELTRSEIERSEQFLRTVWEQKERLEAERSGKGRERVTVMSTAEPATVLNKMGRKQETAGAGVLGLLAGLLVVAAFDIRRNRIHTPADVSRGLRLRVLGALPMVSAKAGRPAMLNGKGTRSVQESVNGLRTALLSGTATLTEGQGLTLMVSSAAPGEGKSTLAAQLAASFARARRRTLLVDCDLRSPSLHRLFGLEPAAGVCEALTGVVDAADTVRPTGIENLDLLSAGRFCLSAEAGLAQEERVRRLISELRGRYDCVVLDSSPVLLVPDALMVGGCVDGLLLSVRPGISQAASVYEGYERLTEHGLPVLGVVVNGVPEAETYRYGYGRSAEPTATAV